MLRRKGWDRLLALLLLVLVVTSASAAPLSEGLIEAQKLASQTLLEQIEEIESEFEGTGDLDRYEAEYRDAFAQRQSTPIADETMDRTLATAPYVFVTDVHTARESQSHTLQVMKTMASNPAPMTFVMEWIDRSFQKDVDAYLAGKIKLQTLRKRVRYDEIWSFPWESYRRILEGAKGLGVPILLVDSFLEPHGLAERDAQISDTISSHRAANPDMRYLVAYGAYHLLGKDHLTERLARAGLEPQVILVDEANDFYWEALDRTKDPEAFRVLDLGGNLYYVRCGSPLERQQAYRSYLMDLMGYSEDDFDMPIDEILAPLGDRRAKFSRLHRTVH